MELTAIYKRVIGLDVHQAKISACALMQQPDGTTISHDAGRCHAIQCRLGPGRSGFSRRGFSRLHALLVVSAD